MIFSLRLFGVSPPSIDDVIISVPSKEKILWHRFHAALYCDSMMKETWLFSLNDNAQHLVIMPKEKMLKRRKIICTQTILMSPWRCKRSQTTAVKNSKMAQWFTIRWHLGITFVSKLFYGVTILCGIYGRGDALIKNEKSFQWA